MGGTIPNRLERDEGGEIAVAAAIVHRRRALAPRPRAQLSDLVIAGSLAGLLAPAWLLPERAWPRMCSLLARMPVLVDRATLQRTADSVQAALVEADPRRAWAIACDLQAAVYQLRMQNLRAWRPGGWNPKIELEGEEHLRNALARGKGAVLWVGHFAFNSNLTKIALHRRGYRVSHLSRPEHGFSKTRLGIALLNPVRCVPEDKYLKQRVVFDRRSPAAAMRRLAEALRAGEAVSITAGAWEGSDLAEGVLCGARITVAIGPPRLAAFTGAALLPVFSVRDSRGGFRTVIERPVDLAAAPTPARTHCAAAVEFLRRHEPWVRQFPDQWRGWKELQFP